MILPMLLIHTKIQTPTTIMDLILTLMHMIMSMSMIIVTSQIQTVPPSHSHSPNTSIAKLGISSFVYRANKPFNTGRLMTILNSWPIPNKDDLDLDQLSHDAAEALNVDDLTGQESCPFVGVLRSKGFCWLAPNQWDGPGEDKWHHNTAMYWSHAGKHSIPQLGGGGVAFPRSRWKIFSRRM